jgi:hypothetical protein
VDVGVVMAEVEEGAGRLEKAADVMDAATRRYEQAENAYSRAVEVELVRIHHEAKQAGERPPAEDLRRALAHAAIEDGIYEEYLAAKAELAARTSRYRALSASVSARQSLLKALSGVGG